MRNPVFIANNHPGENSAFVGALEGFLSSLGIEPQVVDPYQESVSFSPAPSRVILTGVPIEAEYSLSQPKTQELVDHIFGSLRTCPCPVLGICYGHQILAHIFGGEVSSLGRTILDERYPLEIKQPIGILTGVERLRVFAEHRDYVSRVPEGFQVLSQVDKVPYIMYHPGREFYGMQFVPEQSDEETKAALERFVEEK